MRSRHLSIAASTGLVVAVGLLVTACGDLKSGAEGAGDASADTNASAGPESGSDGGTSDGATANGDAQSDPGRGPGPHGSLPSGYCCNADTECRYRHCVDTGASGKMCLDECYQQLFCTRPDITFTCVAPDGGGPGKCQPPSGFACIPANQFVRGTDPIGACCNAADPANADGTAGAHCEGNQCASVGNAPLVCVHRCAFAQDCPSGFECTMFGTSKACVPTTDTYTCK
jgi:hypothetical protein